MTLQARPQSLPLTVDDALLGTLALGVLEAENVSLDPLSREFLDARDQLVQKLVGSYAGRQPADIPGVAEARSLFTVSASIPRRPVRAARRCCDACCRARACRP